MSNDQNKQVLTFTALEMSSVNGGMFPDITAANERPNTSKLASAISFFAPRSKRISKSSGAIKFQVMKLLLIL